EKHHVVLRACNRASQQSESTFHLRREGSVDGRGRLAGQARPSKSNRRSRLIRFCYPPCYMCPDDCPCSCFRALSRIAAQGTSHGTPIPPIDFPHRSSTPKLNSNPTV